MKEAITSLEYQLREAFIKIETMKTKIKALKDGVEVI